MLMKDVVNSFSSMFSELFADQRGMENPRGQTRTQVERRQE